MRVQSCVLASRNGRVATDVGGVACVGLQPRLVTFNVREVSMSVLRPRLGKGVRAAIKRAIRIILIFDVGFFEGDVVISSGKLTLRRFWIRCMAMS